MSGDTTRPRLTHAQRDAEDERISTLITEAMRVADLNDELRRDIRVKDEHIAGLEREKSTLKIAYEANYQVEAKIRVEEKSKRARELLHAQYESKKADLDTFQSNLKVKEAELDKFHQDLKENEARLTEWEKDLQHRQTELNTEKTG